MTEQQARLYEWLLERVDNPVCPTFEEMREAMGLVSKAGVFRLIEALEKQGRVTRVARRANTVRAVRIDPLRGVSSALMIAELKRRGEWPL